MAVHWKHQVVAVDSLWLCVAITSGMALVIGLAQPFAQPQMNVMQSACFACSWSWGTVVIGSWTPGSVLAVDWKGHVPELFVISHNLDMQIAQTS